jgi:RecB family exonuclease
VASLIGRDAAFLPGYAPIQVEWSFGGSSGVPAIDLGGVALKGRADRIDAGPEGLVVVDYKRTRASSLKEIRDNGLVQLQLYAAAASRTLGMPIAGGVYRGLRDGKDRGFVRDDIAGADAFYRADRIDAEHIAELIDEAIASAVTAADEMRAGRIEQTPSATGCRYCAASGYCPRAVAG